MNQTNLNQMRGQWAALMQLFDVEPDLVDEVLDDLVKRYEENGRYYHTLTHVQKILHTIDSLRPYAQNLPTIQLAAWFHDVIYNPHASDNEVQSAIYAERALKRMQIPTEIITEVNRMILATELNYPAPDDIDCQILLDSDLASFASDWAQQEEIGQAIRNEYAFMPEDAYQEGRRQLLLHFQQRERLYYTEPMFTAFETLARKNIARIISTLT